MAGAKPWRGLLPAWLLLLAALCASAATNSPGSYLVKNWSTADGIPHNTVRSIIESRDGYLWIGTANGLARFDGVRFKVFDAANTSDLISDNIFSLFEDRQGTLWLRTLRGLARRLNGRFEFLSPTNLIQPAAFGGMVEDSEGTLWIRGSGLLGRWNGHGIEPVPLPADGPNGIISICPATDGGLWLSASNGMWRLRNGRTEQVARSPIANLLAAGPGGQLWGLVNDRQLVIFTNGKWEKLWDSPAGRCTTLYAASNGDVWIGSWSRNAAYRWREGRMDTFSADVGLEGVRVLCFMEDHDGNVWIGLNAGGVYRLRERRVEVIGREAGFESPNTTSAIELEDGTIVVGVMGSKLHTVNGRTAAPLAAESRAGLFETTTALASAREGGFWAGNFFGGLPRVQNGQLVEWRGSPNGTRALFVDRDGRLWRGMRQAGIEVFTGTNVTRHGTNEGLSFGNVYCFAQDRDGAIWAGTEDGLNRIQNGRITSFGITNGLRHEYISTLCVDSRGMLWAGTLGGGLSGWNGERFMTITTREGLAHDAVDQLIEDDLGNLWLGTRVGLMRLSVAELHDFVAGKIRVITGTLVGREEGLVRGNLWTEYQPASLKTRDGRLWFCTGSGLVVLDPRRFEKPASAPIVHVEDVTVDGRIELLKTRAANAVVIPPGSERVTIRYTGISPSEPAQVRFRYQLTGYDRDWVEAGRTRVADYSHLPPGPYKFRVKAVNNDGVWNEVGEALTLQVRPQFWQTLWFRGLLTLAVAFALGGIFWLQLRRLENRNAAQEAFARKLIETQESERKRIAAELHDSLGQSLLVVRNLALMGASASTNPNPDTTAGQFKEISETAGQALVEVRSISHALRPVELDRLGLTKSIQIAVRKVEESSGVRFEDDIRNVDGVLRADAEINLFRILQECLNNLVKHSQAKTATVELRTVDRGIELVVADDGRGFEPAQRPGQRGGDGTASGLGLIGIVERARAIGGVAVIASRPGGGTRITVTAPAAGTSPKS